MKYVIVKKKALNGSLHCFPVLFADMLCHYDMVPKGYAGISAGFCSITNGQVVVDIESKSDSLKLKPKWQDTAFIQQWIEYGESMGILASELYEEEGVSVCAKIEPGI